MEVVDWAITASDGVECAKGSTDSCVDAGTSVAFNLLPGPSLKLVGRIVDIVKPVTVAKTVDNIANARNLGKKGEEAVRASFNIGEKVRFIMPNGKLRIPDGFIPHHALSEVKNVKLLRLTSQIKDYATIAKNSNVKMVIYLRGTTALSPAMDAFRIQNGISLLRVL